MPNRRRRIIGRGCGRSSRRFRTCRPAASHVGNVGPSVYRSTVTCPCGLSAGMYWHISRLKYEASAWHLDRLDEVARSLRPGPFDPSKAFTRDGPYVPFVAHADGAALQLFGAFDAFACAVAHRFDLPVDQDRVSFRKLRPSGDSDLDDRMAAIRDADEWRWIADFRHPAAHRDVVAAEVRFAQGLPAAVFRRAADGVSARQDVIAELRGLHDWAQGPLRDLWALTEDWRDHPPGTVIAPPPSLRITPADDPAEPPSAG